MPNLKDLTPEQKDALIMDLVRRLNALEARLEKDSHNSSKPPSTDGLKRKPKSLREPGTNQQGAQPGHQGKTLKRLADPDHTVIHPVAERCEACGWLIAADRVTVLPQGRQVIELPAIRFEVTEHRVQVAQCRCGKIHTGQFPAGVSQAAQYGPRVKAAAVYLTQYQQVPIDRAAQALRDLFGLSVSTGTIQNCINETASALAPALEQISQAILAEPVVHFDETSMRVGRTLQWLHSASTAWLTWYGQHAKRGKEALDSFNILPAFAGVAVHDGWRPYADYDCQHALCNAHHLRELIYVWETTKQSWAQDMITLLRRAKHEADVSLAKGDPALAPGRIAYYRRRAHQLVARGQRENPPQARDPALDPRGKTKQSFAYNLLARLRRYADQVWRFIADHRVPFDNNQAERDIRMPKLKQKISGGFRVAQGFQAFCTIRSYLATLRKQRRELFSALVHTVSGCPPSPIPAE